MVFQALGPLFLMNFFIYTYYSYTQFKNSWYLESLAFWADRSLKRENGSGTRNLPTLPQNPTDFYKQIYKQPYTHIWRRLFLINDTDVLKIPDHMKNRIYIGGQKSLQMTNGVVLSLYSNLCKIWKKNLI